MELLQQITVFPLISTLSPYLISNLLDEVLIRGQVFKEGGASFKLRKIYHMKFQNFVFVLFNNENETKRLKTWKNNKKRKHQNISNSICITILYVFIWILVLRLLKSGNFSYKCHINWCGAYWRGETLLGGTLTLIWVLKGATKVLHLLERV